MKEVLKVDNVISIASKFAVNLSGEHWNVHKKENHVWTEKEYIAAYIKLLTKQINNE